MHTGFVLSHLSKQHSCFAGFSTNSINGTVAGRHRASPSATLDKRLNIELVKNIVITLIGGERKVNMF
ncbi:hypothetical protein SAMN04488137_3944 [Fictibacillus solisalsi]|uniref:Uncharacterized protein n=1 Tax=Fictibacillus solisalsi TaxID=459525 RepID=A0A1H0A622_9BACL|nr:hypothetical protein SAMN04488137_3944 [Fictibacillus solisalsi]